MKARILLADEDRTSCQFFTNVLVDEGHYVKHVQTGEAALTCLTHEPYDLLVTDVRLPGMNGLALTRAAHHAHPRLSIVVMTAFGSLEAAVEAIQEGALNYVSKPLELAELKQTVTLALAHRAYARDGAETATSPPKPDSSGAIIGSSPAMIPVYKTLARVAPTKSTVLVVGESGTGKELIARALHQHSSRADGPFVAVDCGSLAETLLESELFGHVRGAFTGAVVDKKGSLRKRRAEPAFSTRSAISVLPCKRSSCASCRKGKCGALVVRNGVRWTCGSSPPRIRISRIWSSRSFFVRISTTVSKS